MHYLAIIEQEQLENGKYVFGISFPDLLGCVSTGDSIDDAVKYGTEALQFHIEGMVEDGDALPKPRAIDAIAGDNEFKQDVIDNVIVYIPVIPRVGKSQQFNFKLDIGLMNAVDHAAKRQDVTRTAFVAASLTDTIKQL